MRQQPEDGGNSEVQFPTASHSTRGSLAEMCCGAGINLTEWNHIEDINLSDEFKIPVPMMEEIPGSIRKDCERIMAAS